MFATGTEVKVAMNALVSFSSFNNMEGVVSGTEEETGKVLVKFPKIRVPMKFSAEELKTIH